MSTVNQMELARLLDVTPKTIRAWESQGCPVEEKSTRRGVPSRYVVADVVRWREAQAALAASGDLEAMDMEEAKRRKLAAEAAIVEIQLARERGEVVAVEIVSKEIGAGLAACRSKLLSVGATVAPRLEIAPDAAAAKEVVDDAINEALDAISSASFSFAGDTDGDDQEGVQDSAGSAHESAAETDAERVG